LLYISIFQGFEVYIMAPPFWEGCDGPQSRCPLPHHLACHTVKRRQREAGNKRKADYSVLKWNRNIETSL